MFLQSLHGTYLLVMLSNVNITLHVHVQRQGSLATDRQSNR